QEEKLEAILRQRIERFRTGPLPQSSFLSIERGEESANCAQSPRARFRAPGCATNRSPYRPTSHCPFRHSLQSKKAPLFLGPFSGLFPSYDGHLWPRAQLAAQLPLRRLALGFNDERRFDAGYLRYVEL